MPDNIERVGVRLVVERLPQYLNDIRRAQRATQDLINLAGRRPTVQLNVDARGATGEINRFVASVNGLNGRALAVNVTADVRAALDGIGRVSTAVRELTGAAANIGVNADIRNAIGALSQVETLVRSISGAAANVVVNADIRNALGALSQIESTIREFSGATGTITVSADVRSALQGIAQIETALRAFDGASGTIAVNADIRNALGAIAQVEQALQALEGTSGTVAINADIRNALAAIAQVEQALQALEGTAGTVAINADTRNALAAIAQVEQSLQALEGTAGTVVVNADIRNALTAIAQVEQSLQALEGTSGTISINADIRNALGSISQVEQNLQALEGVSGTIAVNADIRNALAAITQVEQSLQALQGTSATITVNADIRNALAAIAQVEQSLQALQGASGTIAVNADSRGALGAIAQVEQALQALQGTAGTVVVNVDIRNALSAISQVESSLQALQGGAATVTISAVIRDALTGIARVEQSLQALQGTSGTVVIGADIRTAIGGIGQVETALQALQGGSATIVVQSDIRDALQAIAVVEQSLQALEGTAGTVAINADIRSALQAISQVQTELQALSGAQGTVVVTADIQGALQAIARVEQALQALQGTAATIVISGDIRGALQAISQVEQALQALQGASANIRVGGDIRAAQQALSQITAEAAGAGVQAGNQFAAGFGSALSTINTGALLGVGNRAVDVALGLVQRATRLVTGPVTGATTFEDAIADLSAIVAAGTSGIGATEAEDRLAALIQQISVSPELIAGDTTATAALAELLRGGFTLQDAEVGGLRSVIELQNLAGSTGTDEEFALAGTASARIASINRLQANETDRISKVATAVLAQSPIGNINDLLFAFSNFGSAASTLGIAIEEQGAALIAAAPGFKSARELGTALETFTFSLIAPSDAQAEALKTLGIEASTATGEFVGLASIQEQLIEAQESGRFTQIEFAAALREAFGAFGIQAANALIVGEDLDDVLQNISAVDVSAALEQRTSTTARAIGNLFDIAAAGSRQLAQQAVENFRPVVLSLSGLFEALSPRQAEAGTAIASFLEPFNTLASAAIERVTALVEAGAPLAEVFGTAVREAGLLVDLFGGALLTEVFRFFGSDQEFSSLSEAFALARQEIEKALVPLREFIENTNLLVENLLSLTESVSNSFIGRLIGFAAPSLQEAADTTASTREIFEYPANATMAEAQRRQEAGEITGRDVEEIRREQSANVNAAALRYGTGFLARSIRQIFTNAFYDLTGRERPAEQPDQDFLSILSDIQRFQQATPEQQRELAGQLYPPPSSLDPLPVQVVSNEAGAATATGSESGFSGIVGNLFRIIGEAAQKGVIGFASPFGAAVPTRQQPTTEEPTNLVQFDPYSSTGAQAAAEEQQLFEQALRTRNQLIREQTLAARQQFQTDAGGGGRRGFGQGDGTTEGPLPEGEDLPTLVAPWQAYAQRITELFRQGPPELDEASAFAVTSAGLSETDTEGVSAATAVYTENLTLAGETTATTAAAQAEQAALTAETQALANEATSLAAESMGLVPEPSNLAATALSLIPEPSNLAAASMALLPSPIAAVASALGGLVSAITSAAAQIRAAASAAASAASAARSAAANANSSSPQTQNVAPTIIPGGPSAMGGPANGVTLVGEDGREIFYNASRGIAGIVGVGGPELVNFPAGTTVMPNNDTERVLSRGIRSAQDGAGNTTTIFGVFGDFLRGLRGESDDTQRSNEELTEAINDNTESNRRDRPTPSIVPTLSPARDFAGPLPGPQAGNEFTQSLVDARSEWRKQTEISQEISGLAEQQAEYEIRRVSAAEFAAEASADAANSIIRGSQQLSEAVLTVSEILSRSAVTAEDLEATASGEYVDKTDEFVRRLAAAANDGSFGETLQQAAEALEAVGIEPSSDPRELYRQFTEAWDSRVLFYAEQNLALINTEGLMAAEAAAVAQAQLEEKAAIGAQNVAAYLGQFVDLQVESVRNALGLGGGFGDGAGAGDGGEGAGTTLDTGLDFSVITDALSAAAEAITGFAANITENAAPAANTFAERVSAAFGPVDSLGQKSSEAAGRIDKFSDAAKSAVEEIRKLLRGSGEAAGGDTTESPDTPATPQTASNLVGGPVSGTSLVGESGAELWYNATRRQAGVVGEDGPEVRRFEPGTRIANAAETARILTDLNGGSLDSAPMAQPTLGSFQLGSFGNRFGQDLSQFFSDAPTGFFRGNNNSNSGRSISVPRTSSVSNRSEAVGSVSNAPSLSDTFARTTNSRDAVNGFVLPTAATQEIGSPVGQFAATFSGRGRVTPSETNTVNNVTYVINSHNTDNRTTDYGGLQVQTLRSTESVEADFRLLRTLRG